MYTTGRLVTTNEKLGYEWYARAAKLYEAEVAAGDTNAAYYAALIYHQGTGVSPNPAKAIALLEVASAAGNVDATKLLNEIRAQPGSVVAAVPANPASRRATDPSCNDVTPCVANAVPDQKSESPARSASDAPDDVQRSAIVEVLDIFKGNVDQMTITDSGRPSLTGADRANGITEKWCLKLKFVFQQSTGSQWADKDRAILVIRARAGLHANMYLNYGGTEQFVAGTFRECLAGHGPD
jgi:hypothetical protein